MRKCAEARLPNLPASGILVCIMKNRIGLIALVLVLVCLGLGIALIAIKRQAADQQNELAVTNGALSNNLVVANEQLGQATQKYAEVGIEREKQKKELEDWAGNYSKLSSNLSEVSNNLAKIEVALKASQEETAKREADRKS